MEEVRRELQQWVGTAIRETQWRLCHHLSISAIDIWNLVKTEDWNYDPRKEASDFCARLTEKHQWLHFSAWK